MAPVRELERRSVMSAQPTSFPDKWRRFWARDRQDRALISQAALILPLTEIGLRVFGFRRWKRIIENFVPGRQRCQSVPDGQIRERAVRTARAVRSAELHGLSRPNCLERSMALWWMLRREGVDVDLEIGARNQGGRFEAHAWIELDGQVLNDDVEVRTHYARFDAPITVGDAKSPRTQN